MILDLLFPKTCFSCGSFGSYLCISCTQKLEKVPYDVCPYCRRKSLYGIVHGQCRKKGPLMGLLSFYLYRSVFGKVMKGVKYQCVRDGLNNVFHTFPPGRGSDILSVTSLLDTICFVPIPLHHQRQNQRGFNQAMLIAEYFAKVTNIPVRSDILVRVKSTEQQARATLVAERMRNIDGAFAMNDKLVRHKTNVPDSIILVDDVWTTGATINEAAHTIQKHAGRDVTIYAMTLAR